MKKSQRLQVIIDLKAREEQRYLEVLGIEQEKKNQKEQQLNNLKMYRQDYLNKNAEKLKQGLSVFQLQEFNAFIGKMDQAIEGEKISFEKIDEQVQLLRSEWEKAHLHTKNIEKIQLKAKMIEQKELDKKEQNEMDDRSSRKRGSGIDGAL